MSTLERLVNDKLDQWATICAINGHPLVTFPHYGKTIVRPYCLCGHVDNRK